MKLLDLSENISDDPTLPSLILTPDSAIQRDGRPVFLPEISSHWTCHVSIAYRISRLGKTIGRKFASRYYDAMTLAARMVPLDLCRELEKKGDRLSPFATAFDGAVALGTWIPVEPSCKITVTSPTTADSAFPPDNGAIDSAIELLSRSFIFKTGDIVIPSPPLLSFPAEIDSRVKITAGSSPILKFKIK